MDYVERLCAAGMRLDDAVVLVNDFQRELDWDGLADYVEEYERLMSCG